MKIKEFGPGVCVPGASHPLDLPLTYSYPISGKLDRYLQQNKKH